MRQGILKSLLFVLSLSFVHVVSAYDFETDGIYYNISDTGAEVTYKGPFDRGYSGIISIPNKVTHNNIVYSVTSIGDNSFADCNRLTKVVIGDEVTSVGTSAFQRCSALADVTIGKNVTRIGKSAFEDCINLLSIIIPDAVNNLEEKAFAGCSALRNIKIGTGVKEIGKDVIVQCPSLDSLVIPPTIEHLDCSFNGCNFKKFHVEKCGNPLVTGFRRTKNIIEHLFLCSIDTLILERNIAQTNITPFQKSIEVVVITENVTKLGESAFQGCFIDSLHISDAVIPLEYEHYPLGSVKRLYLGREFDYSFYYKLSLQTVMISGHVKTIEDNKFAGCSNLRHVALGDKINWIGENAFNNCYNIIDVQSLNLIPPIIQHNTFIGRNKIRLYVPLESLSKYKQAPYWREFIFDDGYTKEKEQTDSLVNVGREQYNQIDELCNGAAYTEYHTRYSLINENRKTASTVLDNISKLRDRLNEATITQEKKDSLYGVLKNMDYECNEALNWCLDKDRAHLDFYDYYRQKAIQEQDRYKQRLDSCTAALETVSTLEDINRICDVLTTDIESMKQHVYDLNFAYNQFVNAGYVYETKAVLERLLKQLSDIAEELTEIETGITALSVTAPHRIFTIQGIPVGQDGMKRLQRGIYIIDGKKAVVR